MRETLVIVSFLPFLYYATLDGAFHFRGRRVSLAEHVIHLVIGLAVGLIFTAAVMANSTVMLASLGIFLISGSLDEFVWHRDLPAHESNLHAKEHLALLIFLGVTLLVDSSLISIA
jgi:hypothetical protein